MNDTSVIVDTEAPVERVPLIPRPPYAIDKYPDAFNRESCRRLIYEMDANRGKDDEFWDRSILARFQRTDSIVQPVQTLESNAVAVVNEEERITDSHIIFVKERKDSKTKCKNPAFKMINVKF